MRYHTGAQRRTAGLTCAALLTWAAPAQAQWSAAPAVAIGLAVPGGMLHDAVAEGITGKAGVWMRAPRVPVGFTAEAMYTHLRGGRTQPRSGDMRIGGVIANLTTRRHEGRLDPYGTIGAGWYAFSDPDGRFRSNNAPGMNVGVGEVIALGNHDYFVEVRLHVMRTNTMSGRAWTTFLPLMVGVRY
jgi:hypothetical protein